MKLSTQKTIQAEQKLKLFVRMQDFVAGVYENADDELADMLDETFSKAIKKKETELMKEYSFWLDYTEQESEANLAQQNAADALYKEINRLRGN